MLKTRGGSAYPRDASTFFDSAHSELPSPFFTLDIAALRANYRSFQAAFPDAGIFYALKANDRPAVVTALAALGSGFEAASWHEIKLLLGLGVSPDRIIYGTAVKPRSHVERAAAAGVDRFAADAVEELRMLADAAPGARVFVRAKLDDSGSVFQLNEKFGAGIETLPMLVREAVALGLQTWGLSLNVGSQATRVEAWASGIAALAPAVTELFASGIRLEVLNLGGGFPAPYRDHGEIPLIQLAGHIERARMLLPYQPQLVVEPGRGLVATAVSLVASVISRIERPSGPWLFLDCGVYNALYEALLHQGRTAYPVQALGPHPIDGPAESFVLAGPTGDGLDVIARDVLLPTSVSVGDRLLFENVGAYTQCMASRFNGFPIPPLRVREG
jgi:ornithine decarboxylase